MADRFAFFLIVFSFVAAGGLRVDFRIGEGTMLERIVSVQSEYVKIAETDDIYRTPAMSVTFDSFRRYRGKRGTFYLVDLSRKGKFFDSFVYEEMVVECDTDDIGIALADRKRYLEESNIIVAKGRKSVMLAPWFERLDLQRMKYVVVFTETKLKKLRVTFRRKTPPSRQGLPVKKETWAWRSAEVKLPVLKQWGIRRLYLQIGENFSADVLRLKRENPGLELYALDGSPEDIDRYEKVIRKLNRLPLNRIQGIQLDVEPYLLPEYLVRPQEVMRRYLDLLRRVGGWCHERNLPLSVAVPFWFGSFRLGEKSLAREIFRYADEAVLMSYRSDPAKVLEISEDFLRFGELLRRRVSIGVELLPVSDEEHIVYRAGPVGPCVTERFFHLECTALEEQRRFRVSGESVSFHAHPQRLKKLLGLRPPFRSFEAFVFHDYTMLQRFEPAVE